MNVPFSIFILSILTTKVASTPALSQLIVTRVGPCQDRKPYETVTVSEMSLHEEKSGTFLSGPMWIHESVENGWSIKATMQKCHDIRNLDTCDFYKATSLIKDGCEDPEAEDHRAFRMFSKYVTPKLSCPIGAGNYTIKKFLFFTTGSILITAESKISTSVFGYTYRLEGFNDEDDRIFCVDSILRMVYLRKHDWIGSQRFEGEVPSTKVGNKASAKKPGHNESDDDEDSEEFDEAGRTDEEDSEVHAPSEEKTSKTDDETDEAKNESAETMGNAESNNENAGNKDEKGETNDEIDDNKDAGGETKDSGASQRDNDQNDDANDTEGESNKTEEKQDETNAEPSDTEDGEVENSANKGDTQNEENTAQNVEREIEKGENIDEESENEGESKGSQTQIEEEADENEDDE